MDALDSARDSGPETTGSNADDRERRQGYLGFTAHEIRNPLSTALWTAELLARMSGEERSGPRGAKLSAMCVRALSRVRQLVEDHFVIERIDAGGQPLRSVPVELREVLEGLRARRTSPVVEEVEEGLAVDADRALLERAIDAMVGAAGASGKQVRLEARSEGDTTVVRVQGDPPAPGALDDPRKGAVSDQRGRALALPAARRIAAALGGRLVCDQGAFVLSLPRVQEYSSNSGSMPAHE
jgi:K+-sensing histidine kinase KdpD